jgi:hypothetical protein
MTKDVTFDPVDGPLNDRIDDRYRAKYAIGDGAGTAEALTASRS